MNIELLVPNYKSNGSYFSTNLKHESISFNKELTLSKSTFTIKSLEDSMSSDKEKTEAIMVVDE